MIPILSRAQRILDAIPKAERAQILRRGRYNTLQFQKPLSLETIDQQTIQATPYTTRNNPYVHVHTGRANTNNQVFINLKQNTSKPKQYLSNGTYFEFNKNTLPPSVQPITLEERNGVLRIMQSKKARYRDEGNRQRKDTKARRYKQLLRFVNRTYGTYDDARDVAEAWKYTTNLSDFVEALAVNEAIDFMYGQRSQLINKHINQPLRLPVGALAIRSLWRHGTSH
jgi:hypothetical protein